MKMEKKPLPKGNKQLVIEIGDEFLEVFTEDIKFKKGFGYIHDDLVYIYRGKVKNNEALKEGSVYQKDGEAIWVEPEDKELHSVKRIITYDPETVFEELKKSKLKEIDPALLELADDYFAPKINEDDDILKVIIKEVLARKKIVIKASKHYKNSYDITNLKSGLIKPANLSFKYFIKWAEILGLDLKISVGFINSDGEEDVIVKDIK